MNIWMHHTEWKKCVVASKASNSLVHHHFFPIERLLYVCFGGMDSFAGVWPLDKRMDDGNRPRVSIRAFPF